MVAIKDTEMPKSCALCERFLGACQYTDFGDYQTKRNPSCPLVEIITCKDCKCYRNKDGDEWCTNHSIGDNKFWVREDYHCADAERREL